MIIMASIFDIIVAFPGGYQSADVGARSVVANSYPVVRTDFSAGEPFARSSQQKVRGAALESIWRLALTAPEISSTSSVILIEGFVVLRAQLQGNSVPVTTRGVG
ncbi:hypothetical protein HO173_004186 [Letharia columbiana]|uniref:Uncharacterized protein n=1 Tax=Letharia columbiana TaxID=112416 RepID=A0A8H6L6Z6_9LECA|nr:uncharacterized protein HO173_004186 [Letharia columbiana]KAF6237985.1 hypothetical protein HO173_004186 [Letharia columbiana]